MKKLTGKEINSERVTIAQDTETPVEILTIMGRHDMDPIVVQEVMKNPNTPAELIEEIKSRPDYRKLSVMCPLAWNHIATFSNGDVRMCCEMIGKAANFGRVTDSNGNYLNVHQHTFEDIRNSKEAKELRATMMAGEKPPQCHQCYDRESKSLQTKRSGYLSLYLTELDEYLKNTDSDGTINTDLVPMRDLDLRFGNACNLKCRTCGPNDSDLWYEDYFKIVSKNDPSIDKVKLSFYGDTGRYEIVRPSEGKYKIDSGDFSWYTETPFFNDIIKNLDTIESFYFTGGEPTINKRHRLLLEQCIELGHASKIRLDYNTNFHALPTYLVKYWKEFKRVNIGASIDGYGSTQEYLRPPSKWEVIDRNMSRVIAGINGSNVTIRISPTISILNIFNLPKLAEWLLDLPHDNLRPLLENHLLYFPEQFNLQNIPQEVKNSINIVYNEWFETLETKYSAEVKKLYVNQFAPILKHMNQPGRDLTPLFLSSIKQVDDIRNETLEVGCPELYMIYKDLGYV